MGIFCVLDFFYFANFRFGELRRSYALWECVDIIHYHEIKDLLNLIDPQLFTKMVDYDSKKINGQCQSGVNCRPILSYCC